MKSRSTVARRMRSAAARHSISHQPVDDTALRLRGLAALIDSAGAAEGRMVAINEEAAYFIATELEEMARGLEGEGM